MKAEENPEPQEEYILGVDPVELQRLWTQHEVWAEDMRRLVRRAGLGPGMRVLDLGSGPGATSFELASIVEPHGHVIACDESPECIQDLVKEAEKRGITCVEAHVRRAEDLGIESASLDAVYGRWILSWLPDVPLVFDQVSRALRPGGAYILQEYVDWRSMRLLPRSRAFGIAIDACMASWSRSEGTIDIAEKVPDLAREAGLEVESFTINARTGRPGSPVWGWLGDFLTSYLGRLVRHGHFARDDYESFLVEWKERSLRPESVLIAPVVADVVLRKSGT